VWGASADEEDNIVWGTLRRLVPSQPSSGQARRGSGF